MVIIKIVLINCVKNTIFNC